MKILALRTQSNTDGPDITVSCGFVLSCSNDPPVNLNVALNRQVGALPNLYQAVLFYALWVTGNFTYGRLLKLSGNQAAKR